MSPPAKRARRTSSAESASLAQQEGSESQLRPSVSPNRPTLPPLTSTPGAGPSFPRPSSVIGYTSAQSDWSSAWPHGHNSGTGRAQSRRSMDAKSPVSPMSPKMEGIEETSSTESGLVFTRDASNRAPRSMIACTRCRRQKMKCDGPTQVPCRGCRQSGQPCVFEARSRPKSISVLPSRAPPFYPGRPPTPGGGGNAALGFYPSGAQPAPPTLSRGAVGPPGSSGSIMSQASESYAIRAAREPMPPPPATSISVLTSPYPPAGNVRPPTPVHPPGPTLHSYHPAPLQFPPLSATTGPGPPLQPPLQRHASPPMASTSSSSMGSSVNPEARLRAVESAVRGLSSVPSSINQLQHSLSSVHRAINSLASSVHSVVPRPPGVTEVAENVWEDYRSRAWPLTPWLIGLRESRGLPMLVVDLLGKRTVVDKSEHGRVVYEDALRAARSELGRLITVNSEWTREEIRALGAFATWTNDSSLASLAISNCRLQGLDRIWSAAKSHDDWREWIYLTIMDHLCQLVDLNNPITPDVLSTAWRERLSLNSPSTGSVDVAVRDRDHKLLAWLEYAEMIAEVLRAHNVLKRDVAREESTQRAGVDVRAADAAADIWRRYGTRWDAWAGVWSARSDPILSLHFNYAILYTSTPVIFGREGIWAELSLGIEGRALLERGRDAAVAVIQAICSPEISRTIVYSFTLYRPILALALLHLGHLALLPASPSGLSSTPVITPARVLDIFRGTYEAIYPARPLDIATSSSGLRPDIALAEIVERGDIGIISRLTSNVEPGRDLWRKLLG